MAPEYEERNGGRKNTRPARAATPAGASLEASNQQLQSSTAEHPEPVADLPDSVLQKQVSYASDHRLVPLAPNDTRPEDTARRVINSLLAGESPDGVSPEACGPYSEVVSELYRAHGQGGTVTARQAFGAMAGAKSDLAALIAGDISTPLPREDPVVPGMPALPASARLSEALGRDACHWLDEYIRFSRIESPRSYEYFHEACGLWVLSTVAARRVGLNFGGARYTPLYIALVARSSLYAKTTVAKVAKDVLDASGLSGLLAADDATPQKFIADLSGQVFHTMDELQGVRRERAEMRLAFPAQRGWFYEEFGQKVQAMIKENGIMADFRGILRRLDDCPETYEYGTIGRGSDFVEKPYLALLANITPADLAAAAKHGDRLWGDGFWARMAFVTPPKDYVGSCDRFPLGPRIVPDKLSGPLREWHERLGVPEVVKRNATGGEHTTGRTRVVVKDVGASVLTLGDGVVDAFYAYQDGLGGIIKASNNPDFDGSYTRFAEKALRIAMLFASLGNERVLNLGHWARAQEIAEHWRAGLHALYEQVNAPEPRQEETDEKRVLRAVQAAIARVGRPTAREVRQHLRGVKGTAEVAVALDSLVEAGWLRKDSSGKSPRYSFPAGRA